MDFVTTLPNNISKQILAGLKYTKKKMPSDLVATTVDVTGPQVVLSSLKTQKSTV